MGLSVSREGDVIVVAAAGDVALDEIRDVFEGLVGDGNADGPLRLLVDDRGSGFAPGFDEVRQLVSFWSDLFTRRPTRIAIVVVKEFHFGVGRQITAMIPGTSPEVSIFRDRDNGIGWLESWSG